MAFPISPILDNFDRPNETPIGGNWTNKIAGTDADLNLTSNALTSSIANIGSGWWNQNTFQSPMEFYWTIPVFAGTGWSLSYMCQNVGTSALSGYSFIHGPTTGVDLYRFDSGGTVQLGSSMSQAVVNGDQWGIHLEDGVHIIYVNGIVLGQRTDSTYTSGYCGITIYESTTRFDDFGGGTLISPSDYPPISVLGRGAGW